MRSKLIAVVGAVAIAFLLATNPVVTNAAGKIGSNGIKSNAIKSKHIKNNNVKSADVKDNSLTGKDLKDGTLTGGDLQVRVATASRTTEVVGPPAADFVTTSITAPAKGFLVITGSTEAHNLAGDTATSTCFLTLDTVALTESNRFIGQGANNIDEDCQTQATVVVAAGTYTLALRVSAGGANSHFDDGNLTVMFVPFDGAGAIPAKLTRLGGNGAGGRH